MRVHEDPLHWVVLAWAAMAAGLFFARSKAAANAPEGPTEKTGSCVVAVVAHVQRSISPDGITLATSFRERLYRCGGSVWTERLKAPEYFHPAEPPAGDLAFPAPELARFVTRTSDGGATLLLVSRARRSVIEVAPEDFARAGFDGSWDVAAHVISRVGLVPVIPTSPAERETYRDGGSCRWLGSSGARRRVRALFCEELELPLEIHFDEGPDGKTEDVSVQVLPLRPDDVPWHDLGGFHWSPSSDVPG